MIVDHKWAGMSPPVPSPAVTNTFVYARTSTLLHLRIFKAPLKEERSQTISPSLRHIDLVLSLNAQHEEICFSLWFYLSSEKEMHSPSEPMTKQ